MENFFKSSNYYKRFASNDSFKMLDIGYNDFSKLEPFCDFRVQTFYTLHFVLSGEGVLKTGGEVYDVKAGEMFFLPPNEEICYYPRQEKPWTYVWFSFVGEDALRIKNNLEFTDAPVRKFENQQKIFITLKSMFENLKQGEGYYSALSSFYKVLDILTVDNTVNVTKNAKIIIDSSFTQNNFSLEQLCKDVGVSHPHLLRLFKEKYGITLVKYLVQKRIEYACQLLVTTELSVKSVAYSSGFVDELHFMKTFKKYMGMSANKYRKANV